jgi:integrase
MSIYRDKRTGQWRFDFDRRIGKERIRRRQLLPPGWSRTQADAFDRKESAALYALASGIAKPRRTIDEAVACYLRERAGSLKHGRNVEREIATLRDWWTGRPVDDLPAVCAEYEADQRGALAPATIKNRISYLRAACRYAWRRHGMCDLDPGARVAVPTVRNAREVVIDRAQMLYLARSCPNPGVRALIRVLFYTGMRLGEARRAERVPGAFVLRDTKNREPHIVPMHPRIATAAQVALPPRGTIYYWWEITRAACGLGHVTLHDLRHSAASAMIAEGVSLADVGAVLNHKSAASTKRYAHWALERKTAAVLQIGKRKRGEDSGQPGAPQAGDAQGAHRRAHCA